MPQKKKAEIRQEFGEPVPDFQLPTLEGKRVSLQDLLKDKRGAVVVFWSASCSHCRRYDEYLHEFGDLHPELALVVVASRQHETAEQLRAALAERDLDLRIVHDADRQVARRWLVAQTPRAFLVDSRGHLLYRGAIDNFRYPEDPLSQPFLENAIEDYLDGQPVRRAETPSLGCPIEALV